MTVDGPPTTPSSGDLRSIADLLPHIVWMARADGSIAYVNREGRAYVGRGRRDNSAIHADDREHVRAAWLQVRTSPRSFHLECRIRRADGEFRRHAFRGRPILDEAGAVVEWVGTATDVDDDRRNLSDLLAAQRETAETLRLLETLLSKAPIGFAFIDRDLRVVRVNETMSAIVGSTAAAQAGRLVSVVVPDAFPLLEPLYRQVLETGRAILDAEIAPPDSDAPRRWSTSFYPVTVADEIIGVGVLVVDVTEDHASEDARRQLAAIVGGSGDAIFGVTPDGIITSWNGAAEHLFGYQGDEIIGRSISLITPPAQAGEQVLVRHRLAAGGPSERFETVRRRKDGCPIHVLLTVSSATDEAGQILGLSVIVRDITEQRLERHALEESRRMLAEAQHIAHLGSFEYDLATDVLTWSDEYRRILGLDAGVGATVALFGAMVHPDDLRATTRVWADVVRRGTPFDTEFRIIRTDSSERTVRVRGLAHLGTDGAVITVSGTMMDDSERAEIDRIRHLAETRFEIGFEQTGIGAVISDLDGLPVRVNNAVCEMLGRPPEQLLGQRWAAYSHPDDRPLGELVSERVAAGHDTYAGERRYVRPDGSLVWASSNVSLVRDGGGTPQYFLMQLQDVTSRKQMEVDLMHQAMHDSLTGLPNRALLGDRLRQGLAGSRRRGAQLGVILLDLDHFKLVNDVMGHHVGDEVIQHIAGCIAASIRAGDTVARLGGDEFVVVCDDISAVEIDGIATRVLADLDAPVLIAGREMRFTASLGIAISDAEATPESLVRDADIAMYRAKERGRSRIELFDRALRASVERRLATASALHRALEREELTVHYQPVVDLATGAMVSAEALLRWQHPTRGLIHPDEFIPLAEETGLIVPLGAWVLEQASAQLARWQRLVPATAATGNLTVAVNLSVRQMLGRDISTVVEDVLRRTGVAPADLCLELTESVFMADVDYFGRTLAELKDIGIRLAIDDFGTGYSSLSYLQRFPVDAIKIDQSFVRRMGSAPRDCALVAAIVAMADALSLDVTAEGVETREQVLALRALHVPRAQGFYFARPAPAADLTAWLTTTHRRPAT